MSNVEYDTVKMNINDSTVSKNGVPSIDQDMNECKLSQLRYCVIPFDNGCDKRPLSGWAIAGISIGSIIGVVLIVTVSKIFWKQRQSMKDDEDNVMIAQPKPEVT